MMHARAQNTESAEERLVWLRWHLLPPGTPLADVPPDRHGLSLAEWREYCRLQLTEQGAEWRRTLKPVEHQELVTTARDNYGWRSLPSGTRFLGATKGGRNDAA